MAGQPSIRLCRPLNSSLRPVPSLPPLGSPSLPTPWQVPHPATRVSLPHDPAPATPPAPAWREEGGYPRGSALGLGLGEVTSRPLDTACSSHGLFPRLPARAGVTGMVGRARTQPSPNPQSTREVTDKGPKEPLYLLASWGAG